MHYTEIDINIGFDYEIIDQNCPETETTAYIERVHFNGKSMSGHLFPAVFLEALKQQVLGEL